MQDSRKLIIEVLNDTIKKEYPDGTPKDIHFSRAKELAYLCLESFYAHIEKIANQKVEAKLNGIQRMIQDAENIKQGLNDGLTHKEIEEKYNVKFD